MKKVVFPSSHFPCICTLKAGHFKPEETFTGTMHSDTRCLFLKGFWSLQLDSFFLTHNINEADLHQCVHVSKSSFFSELLYLQQNEYQICPLLVRFK